MTSTSFNIGMHLDRNSSRVLKPPGGGHTSLFGSEETKVINPRPKHDQQNSSNLNFCMNTTDPNEKVSQPKQEVTVVQQQKLTEQKSTVTQSVEQQQQRDDQQGSRSRVPPGGFSSGGFW